MNNWISVKDRLPEDGDNVLIYYSGGNWIGKDNHCYGSQNIRTASFKTGTTKQYRLDNNIRVTRGGDEDGNNKVPYQWDWINGQDVNYWMPLPDCPEEEIIAGKEAEKPVYTCKTKRDSAFHEATMVAIRKHDKAFVEEARKIFISQ